MKSKSLLLAAQELSKELSQLRFEDPVAYTYNPLQYAWKPHSAYLERFANTQKKVVFLGMNPGPFGMAQTGVPFGEVTAVRDWIGICEPVEHPKHEHPKRPIQGFECPRSEVSGKRLWGLFKDKFITPEKFFADHFVFNYCPLLFMHETGKNLTPDKFPAATTQKMYALCDTYLRKSIETLQPQWIIGVGDFARKRAEFALQGLNVKIGTILHPSPASPAANKGWTPKATSQLEALGIW